MGRAAGGGQHSGELRLGFGVRVRTAEGPGRLQRPEEVGSMAQRAYPLAQRVTRAGWVVPRVRAGPPHSGRRAAGDPIFLASSLMDGCGRHPGGAVRLRPAPSPAR
jgi:hypothetical protein